MSTHVCLKISLIHELEDEHESLFAVDNIAQGDYVLVLQLFHEGYLADGGARGAFFGIEVDLLERYEVASLAIPSFENLHRLAHHAEA